MIQKFFILIVFTTIQGVSILKAQKILKQTIVLQMPEGKGSNNAAVVWHPITKKYYSSMAGNVDYPMGVFDEKGKIIQEEMLAEYDFRGMWYNQTTKQVQFNSYDSGGIGHIELDKDGKIKSKMIDIEGMHQPDGNSIGVYYKDDNSIIYFSPTFDIEKYNAKSGQNKTLLIHLNAGCKTKAEAKELLEEISISRWEERNASVQYTNIPKGELAVLNVNNRTIEFYDKKTGFLTSTPFSIPQSIKLEYNFNFSYSNGIWWFFQKENRQWIGCK